jgi:hypothetical protein
MESLCRYRSLALFVCSLLGVGAGGCASTRAAADGGCVVDRDAEVQCDGPGGASAETLGLVGYICSGSARPDDPPRYIDGVPRGRVCADRGELADGARGYCCTMETTSCAYNPVAICDEPSYGYRCRGANRPESLNAALSCGQGVAQNELIDYCCSGTPQPDGCQQSDSVTCSPRLLGWTCSGKNLPKGEQLGANKSRADYYYLLCPTATPAANAAFDNYCCYTPALVPSGGSCVQHTSVPGCQPGRFGFACYGPDTPADDYLPMHCPEPGFAGKSAEGYPATLYCCDFE